MGAAHLKGPTVNFAHIRGCTGKTAHLSYADAKYASKRFGGDKIRQIYQCRNCKLWHFSSQTKAETKADYSGERNCKT